MHMQQLDGVCDTTHLIFYVIVQYITKIGRISMNTTTNEEQLLKHLAVAIVEKPRSTIKELAESVEISKTTLHRFCGTREKLQQILTEKSSETLESIINVAQTDFQSY